MTEARHVERAARYLGAAALLGVGVDHLQQYVGAYYSAIPTIGTLFMLNFAASVVLAAGLMLPIERAGTRGRQVLGCLAGLGIGVAVGSLAALLISERAPLFGFMESGYRQAIVVSIVLEILATVLLAAYAVRAFRPRTDRSHDPGRRGRVSLAGGAPADISAIAGPAPGAASPSNSRKR
jgi:hypothetical protein